MAPRTPTSRTTIRVTNRRPGSWLGHLLRGLVVIGLLGAVGGAAVAVGAYVWFSRDLPELPPYDALYGTGITRFYAADGQVVGEWYEERRIALQWEQVPKDLALAFLAAEDARFFNHAGVDLKGVLRAFWTNLRAGSVREGASTITQQLAKTLVGSERSYVRKIREAILARRIEDRYTKTQILTWYLNAIYLGHGSYGVQAAANNYFRKSVWDLSLAEMAMLAGLPQAPSRVNPAVNMTRSRARMAHVLKNMARRGWVAAEDVDVALEAPLDVHPMQDRLGDHVPHYTSLARDVIQTRYGDPERPRAWLERELEIHLAVEPALQRHASRALGESLADLARKQGYPGPLARLARDDFFARVARWLPEGATPTPGAVHLARVASVKRGHGTAELASGIHGRFLIEQTAWAGPYRETRKRRGKKRGKVSWKPKLKDLRDAFKPGDVILVTVKGGAADALKLVVTPVPLMEGAIVSTPVHGQGVDVMVGGWDFDRSQVNRAHATRPTGSTMKPIVYGKAYDLGLPPSALFSGAPFRDKGYNPTGDRTRDDMLVWDALAASENAVSLRVLQYVLNHTSLEDYQAWGRALGLPEALQGNPAEVLGRDQTPLGMTHAYGVFARRGLAPALTTIRKVIDADGRVLQRHMSPVDAYAPWRDLVVALVSAADTPSSVRIPETTAYLVTRNLEEVVSRGTGKKARALPYPAAGKTGTLDHDVWFCGFSPYRVTTAWIGADRNERVLGSSGSRSGVYGGNTALPAWLSFMASVDEGRGDHALARPVPADVITARIDPVTGMLARAEGTPIPHRRGTEPLDYPIEALSAENISEIETEF